MMDGAVDLDSVYVQMSLEVFSHGGWWLHRALRLKMIS